MGNKVFGFTRVSTDKQTTDNQRLLLLDYAHKNNMTIEEIVETVVSSRRSREHRQIDTVLEKLNDKDVLLVYSLDRVGRSTLETLQIIEEIKEKGVKLIFVKDNIVVDKHNSNPYNEMMLTMLSGFAQLERSFISERTKAGLQRVKESGKKLGRQKGQVVASKYDKHKEKIVELLGLGVSIIKIQSYINEGTPQSLARYVKSRGLK